MMVKYFCFFSLLILSKASFAQYYTLEETNATYAYFGYQERYVTQLFELGLIHEGLNLSAGSTLKTEDLVDFSDQIKNTLSDCYSEDNFELLYLENSLKEYPLESRRTYFYLNTDGEVEYLLQTRIIFGGNDIEKEKFNPKVEDIKIFQGTNIIHLSKEQLNLAFNPVIDEELAEILETMPLPPMSKLSTMVFNNSIELYEEKLASNLTLNIPFGLRKISKYQDEKRGVYFFRSEDKNTSVSIKKINEKDINAHKRRNEIAKTLNGVTIHIEEKIEYDGLKISWIDGTYIDPQKAWTKVIIQGKSDYYVLLLKYLERDRMGSTKLRNKMISSIRLD